MDFALILQILGTVKQLAHAVIDLSAAAGINHETDATRIARKVLALLGEPAPDAHVNALRGNTVAGGGNTAGTAGGGFTLKEE